MTEVVIKDNLKRLVELQKVDSDIYEIKEKLDLKPQDLVQLESDFDLKKVRLKQHESELQQIELRRKELELEIQKMDAEIEKGNAQLFQLKTNKEYSAKITEIEGIKAERSIIEEKTINLLDEIEEVKAQIGEETEALADDQAEYESNKKAIEDEIEELKKKIEEDSKQREQVYQDVDQSYLSVYDKILKKQNGLAIVPLQGNMCGGCFFHLIPQTLNRVKMYNELVQCDHCLRILYLEDEL